jgi:hypothetical protein
LLKLYAELVSVAKENGQSPRFVLERALEHYLHNVIPSQRMVRPDVIAAHRRSNEKYRELYKRLARADRGPQRLKPKSFLLRYGTTERRALPDRSSNAKYATASHI